jgi:methylated-DNA-[protein]-cysteine S-methyltransferase
MSFRSGLQIASLHLDSPLGRIRISGTNQAVSEVHFVEDGQTEQPDNTEGSALDLIVECRRQLLEYFRGNLKQFDIRTDQQGTDFQQKVWEQLSLIRYGDTISYLALARQLGDEKVIRASASANGRNNIAIIIPCHRVIGSSGDLVGYAGGIWRKKWLIDHEKRFAHGVQTLF